MLLNYFAAAFRNLARNKRHATITIGGLAVGLTAALVAALYVQYQLSFEHFVPDYAQIYRISIEFGRPGAAMTRIGSAPPDVARWLEVRLPALHPIARIGGGDEHGIRVGNIDTLEQVSWADPEFFNVFRLPIVAGDPVGALHTPDGVVLTETVARTLFGRDDPIGRTLEIDRKHSLRVMAVVKDLPPNTHLEFGLVASSLSSFSPFASIDARPFGLNKPWMANTYFRLPHAIALSQVRAALPGFVSSVLPGGGLRLVLPIEPITDIHLDSGNGHTSHLLIYAVVAVGVLILLAAAINFINLMTARATTRQLEIGVRKAAGASRRMIALQFLGESVAYAAVATLVAAALVELLLPAFDRFAGWSVTANYGQNPWLILLPLGLAIAVGLLAGAYPAIVLSSFRPAAALRGVVALRGGDAIRHVLVSVQFAVLTGLLIAVVVVFNQISYSSQLVGRLDGNGVFLVTDGCKGESADAYRVLPGVVAAACSQSAPDGSVLVRKYSTVQRGIETSFDDEVIGVGFFDLYGLKPLAGRFFSTAYGIDTAAASTASDAAAGTGSDATASTKPEATASTKSETAASSESQPGEPIVINETAVRQFGFTSPDAAVGKFVYVFGPPGKAPPSEIVGVVPDFPMRSIRTPVDATVFHLDPNRLALLSVKVSARHPASALTAVDARWSAQDPSRPIQRFSAALMFRGLYSDIDREEAVFSACAAIALLLACVGIYGLSAFIAERRTKEMGIRRALGADRTVVIRLLLWQLAKPIIWAQLIAWPVTYLIMNHWLEGFATHVPLRPQTFVATGAAVLLIAWATVLAQALRVAKARPVTALRYE
jgi:putative ABC transport system permease protein